MLLSKKEIISTNQFVWMLFMIITSFTVLEIPGLLIFHAGRDAWLAIVFAWFLDILLAIVYAYMGIRFPGQNFVQYSVTILGKHFGKVVGIMFPLFFLLVASSLMKAISILLSVMVLPKTPMIVILFGGYVLIAYAVKKGIEVIARATEILSPMFLISFILLFIGIIPSVKVERLKPQLAEGFYPVVSGSLFMLTFIGICIMMGMYIPLCNCPHNGFKAKFIASSLGSLLISILVVLSIGVFGEEQAGNMMNPGLQLVRMIRIKNVTGRLDILWLIIAIGAGIITSANLIWASSIGISQILNFSTHIPIVYAVTLTALVLSTILFDSNMEFFNFTFYVYPFVGIFVEVGLEMFLFFMALILKKKG
jgi:spore germination protein (amino acid permease)